MSIQGTDKLKKWLRRALWFVPVAYGINFIYALYSDQSGGTFGDTFGAANALFSGTALLMLVLAVILQREELEIVRDERNDTRKLLEGQESLNKLQKDAIDTQIFEQSFFSLVSLISQERRSLDQPFKPNADVTTIYLATSNAREKFRASKIEDTLQVDMYISKCGTFCRLLTTAYGMLSEREFSKDISLKYASTLHALIDSDVAHCWFILVCEWAANDPRAASAFHNLQGVNFLDERYREFAEKKLLEIV